ncbi:PAS domain S-box protein [Halosolutus halophilus]|uniref:PAS domain S-box protein n=1 Tax=Halosolutus halophilus TaxID=1552990 RepID=UPI0022350795|nr:PAS domain S-box protein [Halosolutus halophilus]
MTSRSLTESLRETLALFDGSGTPRTTTEVADRLDLGRRSTYERLNRLVEHDELETKKVGASARVWWRPPASAPGGEDRPTGVESPIGDALDGADVGVVLLDVAGEVVWINGATERYFGLDREQVLGQDERELVTERMASAVEDGPSFVDTVMETDDETGSPERFECRVTAGEGREDRWLEYRSKPIESGAYAGGRIERYDDVTERNRAEHTAPDERAQFESLVEAVEEYAIFALGPDGHVQTWNAGAAQITGYAADEVLGEHVSVFYTEADREAGVPEANLAAAADEGAIEDEGWRVREDGSQFQATVTVTAIRDDDGDLQGYVKVTRNRTDRKRAQKEHQLQLSLSRALTEAASLEDGLQATLEHVCEWTDWELGQAWVPTDDGVVERLPVSYVESDAYAPFDEASLEFTFNPGEGIPGRALSSGTPVWFPDVSALPEETYHRTALATEVGVKAGLGVPVLVDGEVAVILEFYMSESRGKDDWLVEVVTAIAAELGSLVGKQQARDMLERERDLLETIFDTSPIGLAVLDDQGEIVRANGRAEELLGLTAVEIEGRTYDEPEWNIWDGNGDPIGPDEHPVTEVFETGEPVLGYRHGITLSDGTDRWLSSNASPVLDDTGDVEQVIVALEDVTQLEEQARRLERQHADLESELQELFERVDDAFYALDDEMRFTYVNDRAEELLGYSGSELLGRSVWEALSVADDDPIRDHFETAMATQTATSFERFSEPLDIWENVRVYPSASGLSVYFTDITERKERERELEEYRRRYRTFVEHFPNGAVALVDEDLRYVTFGGTLEGDTDVTRADLEGAPIRDALPRKIADVVVPCYEAALDGEISAFEETIDGSTYQFHFVPVRDDDGDVFTAMGLSQDITEQKERERRLEESEQRYRTLVDKFPNGIVTLFDEDFRYLIAGGELYEVFDRSPDETIGKTLYDRSTAEEIELLEPHYRAALSGESHSFETEYAGRTIQLWTVPVTDESGSVFAGMAMFQDVTERRERERELERQREQLAALDDLNDVVRSITDEVVDRSTREEIEQVVCEHLAAAESYLFAWIGDVDVASQTVSVRTEAGVEGYLDGITISADPDDERSMGPTGRAILEREIQTTQDIRTDSRHDPWRSHTEEYGFRSSAAIPIVHEDTVYGVLNVYADRPNAFEGQERTVISQLGEVVAHAIAATERKRALMSDDVVELQFRIRDVFDALDVGVPTTGRVTLDHTVPIEGDEYLVYGSATADAVDSVAALVETVPHWVDATFRNDSGDTTFELRLSEPPVLSTVASLGGSVENVVIEDGDYLMTLRMAPGSDVRRVIDAVQTAYPAAELLKHRQTTRRDDTAERVRQVLTTDLTDRQRATLEAAYHAGFFEWPRDASGEAVAESLDIAPATFHQHLRKAQQRVFRSLLSTPAST